MRTNQLRVAFLTHGGATVGLGHIRRCLALARGLAERGADSTFLVSPGAGLGQVVKAAGFEVAETAWEDSTAAAVNAVRATGATTAVIDTYTATPPLFDALRAAVGRLVAIDDTADRLLPVDVVINGGLGAETLVYRASPDTVLLLGPRYALLEPQFAKAPDREPGGDVRRILVTLGGSAQPAAASAALAAARSVAADAVVDIVLGPYAETAGVLGLTAADRARVTVHGHVRDPRPLMVQTDLAITNAGMTLYELAASTVPCIMVMTALNQARNVRRFQEAGAALFGGEASNARLRETLEGELGRLVTDRSLRTALGAAARRLVDGQGARRAAEDLALALGTIRK